MIDFSKIRHRDLEYFYLVHAQKPKFSLAMILLRNSFCMSARSFSIAARTWYSVFFYCPLSPVLHVTLANWQRFRFEFHLRSSPDLHLVGIVDQLITSLLATPCWRDPTRSKQLSTVAILGFQFGLYHAVAPLSSLRSISLASLFAIISFFADQIYRSYVNKQHFRLWSFASLC